jgi:RecB family exonuclease
MLYITTSSNKVAEIRKTFHRLMASGASGEACYIPPEMLTLKQYASKLHSRSGGSVLPRPSIPVILSFLEGKGLGFSALTADFISEIKQGFPLADPDSIRLLFLELFRQYNMSEAVANVALQCVKTYASYEAFKLDHSLPDDDDIVGKAVLTLGSPHAPRFKSLVLDGLYCPSPAELDLIEGLIRKADRTFVSMPYDPVLIDLYRGYADFLRETFDAKEIELPAPEARRTSFAYHSYPDMEEEVEEIARTIKSLYVSGKFKDLDRIVVAFPDLAQYSEMIERIFHRYGIPVNVSGGKSAGRTGPFTDLFCLLDAVTGDYPRLSFTRFLASPHFEEVPACLKKWIPSLSILSGIVSGGSSWTDFISQGSENVDIGLVQEKEELGKGLEWVFKKLRPLEEIRLAAGIGVHTIVLRKALEDLGFPGAMETKNKKDINSVLRETLDRMFLIGELFPVEVSLGTFSEILKHLLNSVSLITETEGVLATDLSSAVELSPEYFYIGGLTEQYLPARGDMDYILPDCIRKKAGLMHLDKHMDIQKFQFRRLINSGVKLHLSCPAMEGDDLFLPSPFLFEGSGIFKKTPGIFSIEEYLVAKGEAPFSGHLSEITLDDRSILPYNVGGGGTLRVTDVDAYRNCPRRFFVERVLEVRPLKVKEYGLEAVTVGIIAHRIMERLMSGPLDTLERLKERAEAAIEAAIPDKKIDAYWKDLIRDTFMNILPDIFRMEEGIRGEDYISTEVERTIAGEPLKGIRLKGKIDRFDRVGDGVRIIDYKTGSAGLTCSQALKGNEELQLFLYASIMKNQGFRVDRVGLYSLKDITVKWCPSGKRARASKGRGKTDLKQAETIDDYITVSLQCLEEAVTGMRKGDFRAEPREEFNCRYCHENPFCPYMQQ